MNYRKGTQTRGCMKSVMRYVSQLSKTLWDAQQLVSGIDCQPETAFDEFLSTKLLHRKDGGVMFYHMVQSFPKGADIDPRAAHEAARRLTGYFEGCEVLVCMHTDREHIYALYLQGCGQKEIARKLNSLGRKTPAQIRAERLGYDSQKPHKTRDGQFLWTYASVKNVLVEEAYTGVLVNHRREYLGGKARAVSETDWLRHENSYPVIIEKIIWQQVQTRLKQQARPAVNNRTKHRYAGLLTCQECGNVFSPMIRCWNGSRRVEYVCWGYHRNGKGYCSSHRIHEEILDKAVWDDTEKLREQYAAELKKVTQPQKQWALRKPVLDAHCLTLQKEILRLEQEVDALVMERLNGDGGSSAHEIGT